MSERAVTINHLTIEVSRDGLTGGIQVSINEVDDNGSGRYRILGPKFSGTGTVLAEKKLDEWDAREIRAYLDRLYPIETGQR